MAKIVIVDDHTLIAKLYESNLIAEGHEVRVAFDGPTGIEAVNEFKPDLLLIDLLIPEVSGTEVISQLRSNPEFADLPILAYSGGDDEMLDAARQAGASQVISKKDSSLRKILDELQELLVPGAGSKVTGYAGAVDDDVEDHRKATASANRKVLIVEDDLLIVIIVKDIVQKFGYEAVIAGDGREAYHILARNADFAAGIFDVHVPYIEGPDLLKHMRTEKRLMKIPVMIMTAEETIKIQLASIAAGAAVFVQKPFERKTFESVFKALVAQ